MRPVGEGKRLIKASFNLAMHNVLRLGDAHESITLPMSYYLPNANLFLIHMIHYIL